ncbi:mycothiol transferase, partial [Corynebacterium amycolatum]|uniref:mycothiol transferase n=1 Tax=Corynebacterium amycolatum TaxID=43765 RepID=UPI00211A8958
MTNSTHSASTNSEWPLDAHILGRMDKLAALVATLDDDAFNATLPIPAINSLAVLLRHVTGSARYWLERVCLGRDYVRDRDGEFSAHCSVSEGLEIYHRDRAAIESALVELQGVDRAGAPAVIPTDKDRWWCGSIEGVIVHVFHEAAQHLGHAEITRDALGRVTKVVSASTGSLPAEPWPR